MRRQSSLPLTTIGQSRNLATGVFISSHGRHKNPSLPDSLLLFDVEFFL
jgi:hypothetical protein